MAEPQVYADLVFKFTSGNQVAVDLLEGRDTLVDSSGLYTVTSHEGGVERVLTIYKHKLDALECTKRIVTPERQHGDTLLELT